MTATLDADLARLVTDAADRLAKDTVYARDVQQWADVKLGAFMWSAQRTIAELTMTCKRVGCRSCHSSGKSYLAALLGCHHIDTHVAGTARLITTAPSNTQVRGVLWNEINQMWETANTRQVPMQGRVNQTEWWIGKYQAGIGKKPDDYHPEVFAGFHCEFPFIILDEADGLPPEMWDGVEALMTSKHAKMLAIGNPLDPGSRFAQVQGVGMAKADPDFTFVKIAAEDTPNFTGEVVPQRLKDQLIDKDWVDGRFKVWGPDNPFWYGRVLAEYPPEALATIIHAAYIEACMLLDEPEPTTGLVQLGVDVAASEDGDKTVIRERRGNTALRQWEIQTADDDAVENFVVQKVLETGAKRVAIDATGFGKFFPSRVRKRVRGVTIIPVNFAAKAEITNDDAKKSRKYVNMRAQLWWETGRELLRTGAINLAHMEDTPDGFTVADLTSARYVPESLANGLIQVEEKDEMRKRLKRSPDYGDAFLLAFYEPLNVGGPVKIPDRSRYADMPRGAALGRT